MFIHNDLAGGRWQTMTLAAQLGNIGSEFTRARKWQEKGDHEQRQKALERALELIDLTIQAHKTTSACKEVGRLRELTADQYCQTGLYQTTLQELENYTTTFVLLERV